jgi:hypothetical protein
MSDSGELLSQYDDALLGLLVWTESGWTGTIGLADCRAGLLLDIGDEELSRENQLAAIEHAKPVVRDVQVQESTLRQQASNEIAEAAGSEAAESEKRRYMAEAAQAAESLKPDTLNIYFGEGGHLEYRDSSGTFFGNATIIVRFDQQANYEEAEVHDRD